MATEPDIQISAELGRTALKLAIKATLREMAVDAMQGRTELPTGLPANEDFLAEFRARLVLLDKLVNPPSCECLANSNVGPEGLRQLVADLNSLVERVAARLENPIKGKRSER
jgi:hypothetical protein